MNETTKREPVIDAPLSEEEAVSDSNDMSRRKALAILGKYTAVYAAPAVLALLATKRASANYF